MATTLDEVMVLAKREQGLAVVATLRADQTIQASLVNAGALLHPITGEAA
ncbi:MAG: pyridoxamine 5'-phosphate oxidase, partial [Ilumatobacteraceae bacterium]